MAEMEGAMFVNPGVVLTLLDGKYDEQFFLDGTHPNEKGYSRIVKDIVSF